MGMAFLSKTNKVSAYSPSIRHLASKLRLLSAQTGTTPLVSHSVVKEVIKEVSQKLPPQKENLIAASTEHFGQGVHQVTKIYGSNVSEAINLNDDLTTPVHTQKSTSTPSEPKAVELKVVDCPESMKQKVKDLFPEEMLSHVTVLNLTQKTQNDMSVWGADMEIEWMVASSGFVETAIEACKILKSFGYWADFINPSSGKPYLSTHQTDASLNVTDDEYKSLGFDVSDMGCCRILAHVLWGTKVFVGTIFTDAPINSLAVNEILAKAGSA